MKKSQIALLAATVIFLSILLGIFIGRNTISQLYLPVDKNAPTVQQGDGKLDLNTATQSQLTLLPGIGEELAARIIDYRTQNGPFSSITELMDVDGIGRTKFENIQNYIKAGG